MSVREELRGKLAQGAPDVLVAHGFEEIDGGDRPGEVIVYVGR